MYQNITIAVMEHKLNLNIAVVFNFQNFILNYFLLSVGRGRGSSRTSREEWLSTIHTTEEF